MIVRTRFATLFVTCITILFAGCSSESNSTVQVNNIDKTHKNVSRNTNRDRKVGTKVIRIGWVYAMANAPLIVAEQKGYFRKQGIEVKLKSYTSGPPIRKDLAAGKLDMAYMGVPPVYHWYSKGLKSKIIAKVNYGQAAVIVHKKSPIRRVSDLRNKRFAGVKIGSGMDVLLRGYVLSEKAQLNPKSDLDITTMKPAKMGRAIERGEVAGAFSFEPFTSRSLLRGNTRLILDVNKDFPRYPWFIIMALPDALKNKRDGVIKVLKAHAQAVKYLNSSPTAGNDIIIRAFHLKTLVDSAGKRHAPNEILKLARKRLGWHARLTNRDTEFMQRLMNYSYSLGFIKKKLKADDLIDINLMYEALVN